MKTFRTDLNDCLKRVGYEFQRQPYDHVLREDECEKSAVEDVAEYIAQNPERKLLVDRDHFVKYPYTACLIPGYPNLRLFQPDSDCTAIHHWDLATKKPFIHSKRRKTSAENT